MNRRTSLAAGAVLSLLAAGAGPALAAAGHGHKPAKPLKGTLAYTDVTPDSTVDAGTNAGTHCHGKLPSAPPDVNTHALKIGGRGTLTVKGHTTGDWAMEVRDSRGNVIAGSDGGTPTDQEGALVGISRAGTYQVVFCNLAGAPTATADYTFKPARVRR